MNHMKTRSTVPYHAIFGFASCLLLAGCSAISKPMAPPLALSDTQWQGTWMVSQKSFFGYNSTQALVIEPGGTGLAVTSAIYYPNKWQHMITVSPLTWHKLSPTELSLQLGEPVTVSGDGTWSWRSKKSGATTLYSTQSGLRMDALGFNGSSFSRSSGKPTRNIANAIASEVAATMQAEGGHPGSSGDSSEMSPNQIAGLMLAGAAIGSTAGGNLQAGHALMNQAAATYSGMSVVNVNKIGNYDRRKYFVAGVGKPTEVMSRPSGTAAQLREAYPDGKAWDVQFLDGSVWKVARGVDTASKNSMLATGNAVIGANIANRNTARSYKPYVGMKVGAEAINPP